jgi:hypothetical protein
MSPRIYKRWPAREQGLAAAIFIDGLSGGQRHPKTPSSKSESTRIRFRRSMTNWASAESRSSPSQAPINFTVAATTTSAMMFTGIHNHGNNHTAQIANTVVLGVAALNETRFQFYRAGISSISEDASPRSDVLNSFIGRGAQIGNSFNLLDTYELQNYTTISHDAHTLRFGVRARAGLLDNTSPINFGGSYTFAGRLAPELDANNQPVLDSSRQRKIVNINSIESYRRTLLFQRMILPSAQIRTLGRGASQFSVSTGNPPLSVNQEDVGIFIGDDWHAKRNLTLNLGIRYEWQTNLHDWRDVAPRFGLAWAPGGGKTGATPTIVIRAGLGMFYQRFDISDLLTARRYNGTIQQQYVVTNPDFFPSIPTIASLVSSPQPVEQLSAHLRAPYLMQSALAVERQLPGHTTVALTYVNAHGLHQDLANDINAPLTGSYDSQVPGSRLYPLGAPNPVFLAESSGLYKQNELIANVTSKLNDSISLFGLYIYSRARGVRIPAKANRVSEGSRTALLAQGERDRRHLSFEVNRKRQLVSRSRRHFSTLFAHRYSAWRIDVQDSSCTDSHRRESGLSSTGRERVST